MHTDWTIPYHAAMREQEGTKLESLVEAARRAIHRRNLELGTDAADVREQHALDEALRQLTLHRYKASLISSTTCGTPYRGRAARPSAPQLL